MTGYEIVEYYIEYKNVLLSNMYKFKTDGSMYYIELQKSVCKILKEKVNVSDEVIFREYLKDEKLY